MNTELLNEITAEGYSAVDKYDAITSAGGNVAEYVKSLDELTKRIENLPCVIGCIVVYMLCRSQNPGQAGEAICMANYGTCVTNCGLIPGN